MLLDEDIGGDMAKATYLEDIQGLRGPMIRARTKAMKEALNCFIRELKEFEHIYFEEASFNMSNKSPRKMITLLKAQKGDI